MISFRLRSATHLLITLAREFCCGDGPECFNKLIASKDGSLVLNFPHISLPIGKETDGIGEGEKVQNIRQRWDLRRSLSRGTKDICTECRLDRGMANQSLVNRHGKQLRRRKQLCFSWTSTSAFHQIIASEPYQYELAEPMATNALTPPSSAAVFSPLVVCLSLTLSSLCYHSINPAQACRLRRSVFDKGVAPITHGSRLPRWETRWTQSLLTEVGTREFFTRSFSSRSKIAVSDIRCRTYCEARRDRLGGRGERRKVQGTGILVYR